MKRFASALLAVIMMVGLTSCGWRTVSPDEAREVIQVIAMDTVMIFTTYGEKSTHADYLSEDEARRLEALLSRTDEGSVIYQLNHAGGLGIDVGEEVCGLMAAAEEYTAATDGAFDITIAPVASAWGFTEQEYRVITPCAKRMAPQHSPDTQKNALERTMHLQRLNHVVRTARRETATVPEQRAQHDLIRLDEQNQRR